MMDEKVSEQTRMEDRVVMVTGVNSGIGKSASMALAKMSATVVMVARNRERGEAARSAIIRESQNSAVGLLLADLSSLALVRQLATDFQVKYSRLDVLVNNAGLFNQRRNLTSDGYENTFATNCLAPFLLTNLLLDRLIPSAPSRIINVPRWDTTQATSISTISTWRRITVVGGVQTVEAGPHPLYT
jgi:NAD(P)-dependent dehydrogenase (short-subunit alcohol dehydrogenase family)